MRVLGWLGAAALAFTVGSAAQAEETIRMSVVLPFSGANADLGHQIDKAFDPLREASCEGHRAA